MIRSACRELTAIIVVHLDGAILPVLPDDLAQRLKRLNRSLPPGVMTGAELMRQQPVEKDYPDILVETFAYNLTSPPPKAIKPPTMKFGTS